MENKLYKDFECNHSKEKVVNWRYVDVDNCTRILLKVLHNGGFYFYVLSSISHIEEPFEQECEVSCLFSGIAYYDVIRHLYMGDGQTNNEGYLYYPNFKLIKEVFYQLEILQSEYCVGE